MILLIVDTQNLIMTDNLFNFKNIETNIIKLIEEARKNRVEVIYIRHDDGKDSPLTKGKDGFEIYHKFKPKKTERIYDKKVNSIFKETGLKDYLDSKNEKNLVIVGLQTDFCIDASIKCGFEHGYNILIPEYTNSTIDNEFMTSKESYKYYNNYMWNNRYAKCISLEDTIKMIKTQN